MTGRNTIWWALAALTFAGTSAHAQRAEHLPTADWVAVDGVAPAIEATCPLLPAPRTFYINTADPAADKAHHDQMRETLVRELAVPNTTVVLGPDVLLDFSDAPNDMLPISFGACTTLTSTSVPPSEDPVIFWHAVDVSQPVWVGDGTGLPQFPDAVFQPVSTEARTPGSPGPLLKFGPHRSDAERVFIEVNCTWLANDNVRLSGFRVYGPSFGQQEDSEIGIFVIGCVNVELSNLEVAGFGGEAIHVLDEVSPEVGRIEDPSEVRIHDNYIHHNQHPREGLFDGHAGGYGVEVGHGAWAQIYRNVFDSNRHAIAAAGDMGGYEAVENLVLKGGGYHYAGFHTHQFDIHGTGDNGFGGDAGVRTLYAHNSFQYRADNAIGIRGRPKDSVMIRDNVFPHEGLEDDWGDDAVMIDDRDNLDVIHLGPNNRLETDTYGKYGVCDFDGDGVDDLFLPTGQTWWFSSYGEFPWSYLATRIETLDQVRLGYFDGDARCDVLTQDSNGAWVISSGGTAWWTSIGNYGANLSDVVFGRFDPNIRDHRAGATRRTTHAFRRRSNGQWQITTLQGAPAWQDVQSSSFPMSALRFGDFTGDGVTDVLAVSGGRWSISDAARGSWKRLNSSLSDGVAPLLFADLDNNNIDDILKVQMTPNGTNIIFKWYVSYDGRTSWQLLKQYTMGLGTVPPRWFAGRFGAAPGGGVLAIDTSRIGRFFAPKEVDVGASPDYSSTMAY